MLNKRLSQAEFHFFIVVGFPHLTETYITLILMHLENISYSNEIYLHCMTVEMSITADIMCHQQLVEHA